MTTAEKDTECEGTDSAEDFEKKDHQYASSGSEAGQPGGLW